MLPCVAPTYAPTSATPGRVGSLPESLLLTTSDRSRDEGRKTDATFTPCVVPTRTFAFVIPVCTGELVFPVKTHQADVGWGLAQVSFAVELETRTGTQKLA